MPAFCSARGLLTGAIAMAATAVALAPTTALAADATLDDRSLTRSAKGWSDANDAKAASGTLSRAKKKGATLTIATAAKDGGSVVAQVGPGRGSFSVTVGGKNKKTILTSASKKALKSFSFKGAGTVKFTVTKLGAGVSIDAVKLKGVPQPSGTGPGSTSPGGSTPGSSTPGAGSPTPAPAPTPTPGGSLTPPAPAPVNLGALVQVNTSAAGVPQDGYAVTTVAVSPSGRFVAFWAIADNLVPGATDGRNHLYVKNLATGAIQIVDKDANGNLANDSSPSSGATQALAWKPDETEIIFGSFATNLTNVAGLSGPFLFSKDLTGGVPTGLPGLIAQRVSEAAWSPDGSKIAFGTSTDLCAYAPPGVPCVASGNSEVKLYSWDIAKDTFTPVSATAAGVQPTVYPMGAYRPTWSPDSTKVAFVSQSSQLVPGDTNASDDVFVKTLSDRSLQRVSINTAGAQANAGSEQPTFSPDGTKIAFESRADNLAPGDTNSIYDVFVRDLGAGTTSVISTGEDGAYKLFGSRTPRWSPDGSKIAFGSESIDLIPGFVDANQREDIYVKTLSTGKIQLVSARPDGVQGNSTSRFFGVLGSTGTWVSNTQLVFRSAATNFAAADGNNFQEDIFLKTLN